MTEQDPMDDVTFPLSNETSNEVTKESLVDHVYREVEEATGVDLRAGGEAADPRVWGSHKPVLRRLIEDCLNVKDEVVRVMEMGMGPHSSIDVFAEYLEDGLIDLFSIEEGKDRTLFDIVDRILHEAVGAAPEPGELKTWFYPQQPAGTPEAAEVDKIAKTIDLAFIDSVDKTESDNFRRRSWRHFCFVKKVPVIVLHDSDRTGVPAYGINPSTARNMKNDYHALEFLSTDSPRKTATAVLWLDGCPYDETLRKLKDTPPEGHILNPDATWVSAKFGRG